MSVTRPVVKTETLKKRKLNQPEPPPGKWPIRKVVLSPGRKQWDLGVHAQVELQLSTPASNLKVN